MRLVRKVLKEDVEEPVSHVICLACYEREVRLLEEMAGEKPEPMPETVDWWFEFLNWQMKACLVISLLLILIALAFFALFAPFCG